MHIGYWMILVCMGLVGCVAGMIVYEHYKPVNRKMECMQQIDRIAAQQGLRVQYVKLKGEEEKNDEY